MQRSDRIFCIGLTYNKNIILWENNKMFGQNVTVKFKKDSVSGEFETVLHNVTEIHYNYRESFDNFMIAFESDIHGTGVTYRFNEIFSFEAIQADKKENNF